MSNRNELFDRVAASIIAALELAQADMESGKEWSFPWVKGISAGSPTSIDGRPYRGMNWAILAMTRAAYPSQIFGTYKAWQRHGAQVSTRAKGKGITVLFWKFKEIIDPETGKKKRIGFARAFTVFPAELVDGFDLATHQAERLAKLPNVAERLAHADAVFDAYATKQALPVNYGGDRAYYSHSDYVQMPNREAFKSTAKFYSTLAHELAHSTGAKNRLNREFGARFGDEKYAAEELVAELSAAMTCAALNIETATREDHGRYIASWLKTLKNNSAAVISAASFAQKAADMILGDYQAEAEEAEEMKEAA
jgi:antirestriction protein ArdC